MPVLHGVGPIKVYLTIYDSLKNRYLKKVFLPSINVLANFNSRDVLYEDNSLGIEVVL